MSLALHIGIELNKEYIEVAKERLDDIDPILEGCRMVTVIKITEEERLDWISKLPLVTRQGMNAGREGVALDFL